MFTIGEETYVEPQVGRYLVGLLQQTNISLYK